ncbi:MAG: hypothetical protein ACK5NT_00735 [Pyrinomonadaceae bacterium]
MKTIIISTTVLILFCSNLSAQCLEPQRDEFGNAIAVKRFTVSPTKTDAEHVLALSAFAKGTSWKKPNAEAAVLTVFIDGKYNQDIVLYNGDRIFDYKMLLGRVASGSHLVEIISNPKRSAPTNAKATIRSLNIEPLVVAELDLVATSNAPFLSLRRDTIDKFSDIPLLTYYEVFTIDEKHRTIRYTTIFTNEDGGTHSEALMARWGRMTDIEWVMELETDGDKVRNVRFQGANHKSTEFHGERIFGAHPAIYDSTTNNNFADVGCSQLRTAQVPILVDLTGKSREKAMDENAFTYRIMAYEAIREGRINSRKMDTNTIADPRDYIYAEIYAEPENAAISLKAVAANKMTFTSDARNKNLRVDRKGYSRIAIYLPRNARTGEFLVSVVCNQKNEAFNNAICKNTKLSEIITLNKDFLPVVQRISTTSKNLNGGEKTDIKVRF